MIATSAHSALELNWLPGHTLVLAAHGPSQDGSRPWVDAPKIRFCPSRNRDVREVARGWSGHLGGQCAPSVSVTST
jgi:hypothetical protein